MDVWHSHDSQLFRFVSLWLYKNLIGLLEGLQGFHSSVHAAARHSSGILELHLSFCYFLVIVGSPFQKCPTALDSLESRQAAAGDPLWVARQGVLPQGRDLRHRAEAALPQNVSRQD